ncbi:hypothetical protein AOQ72_10430 [Bradyrhizobium yuanmingense]|uniref:Uncharacterized protein n=1 Tax=Bradyrhizobium yuanmingense TaxID=108015 RepID=A0A0R3CW67_9BRAD|nr:hypothetical protein AOQ72_10430 [Bradyrhizobium yuanmingense]
MAILGGRESHKAEGAFESLNAYYALYWTRHEIVLLSEYGQVSTQCGKPELTVPFVNFRGVIDSRSLESVKL